MANKKVSAIDAIIHPFQFKSSSTQTESEPHDFRLGGKETAVSVFNKSKGKWESISRVEGGEVRKVSYRVRTGKTKREALRAVRETKVDQVEVKKAKPSKK